MALLDNIGKRIFGILLGTVTLAIAAFVIGIVARVVAYAFGFGWNLLP